MHPAACATHTTPSPQSRFTGKERDAESGNDYFGARYYASTMGRFMSPDWSTKAGCPILSQFHREGWETTNLDRSVVARHRLESLQQQTPDTDHSVSILIS